MNLNNRLHECAQTLNDGKLLTKLSGGDAIAQELKYHCACLSGLYNRERSHLKPLGKESSESEREQNMLPLVISELVNYIVESSVSSDGPAVFHLADMSNLCQHRLEQLGVKSLYQTKGKTDCRDP